MVSPTLRCNLTVAATSPRCFSPSATTPLVGDHVGCAPVASGVEVCTSGGHGLFPSMASLSFASVVAACGVVAVANGTSQSSVFFGMPSTFDFPPSFFSCGGC